MTDWNQKFKAEYDYAKGWLNSLEAYQDEWQPLVKRLRKLMSDEGFDPGYAASLDELRKQARRGKGKLIGHAAVPEDKGMLGAVGAWTDNGGHPMDAQTKMRLAALKLLRHVYLLNRSGNRKTWLLSLPNTFRQWPSDDFNARVSTEIAARVLLRADDEIFQREQKKYLANSVQQAMSWCQRTGMVLALAAKANDRGAGTKQIDALKLVKRWFADPALQINDLNIYIGKLAEGFKKIIAMLNKGHFVLTDWVPLRGASTADEINFLNSEAFTFASRAEGMDVVYIERSFFVDHPGNVLKGQKNWTRIMVHELTHLVCGTEDVNIGNARYAWYGIGPHAGYPGSAAIRNADNWAFFCADCAGALTESERNTALKII